MTAKKRHFITGSDYFDRPLLLVQPFHNRHLTPISSQQTGLFNGVPWVIKSRFLGPFSLKNRQKIANDRISQAESEAIESIKQVNVEIAIKATEELLQKRIDNAENLKMIDEAIEELPNKLVG